MPTWPFVLHKRPKHKRMRGNTRPERKAEFQYLCQIFEAIARPKFDSICRARDLKTFNILRRFYLLNFIFPSQRTFYPFKLFQFNLNWRQNQTMLSRIGPGSRLSIEPPNWCVSTRGGLKKFIEPFKKLNFSTAQLVFITTCAIA